MITTVEREGLDKVFTPAPSMPAKGQPMDDSREGWKYLANVYAGSIACMRDENSRLRRKIDKLEQKRRWLCWTR